MTHQETASENSAPVIYIDDLSITFATRTVLNGIHLRIPAHQSLCLCGVNGAGKSTMMRAVASLLAPTKGAIKICGHDVRKEAEITKPLLGVISHKRMLYANLTVQENLAFYARLYGVKKHKQRVQELLEEVNLWGFRHDMTGILSHGMLQRLAIARALIHRPVALLADEPFTGLDVTSSNDLVRILNDFRDGGGTIIMTTHVINFAILCCDRMAVLDKTKLIFDEMTESIDIPDFERDYLEYARRAC